ncbi:MAG: hypothetical protein K2N27_01040 [Ruminococcus sp.]|nr:hypothetical protein [Ruminococcus sp.]
MRKFLIILVMACMLSFVGCTGGSSTTDSSSSERNYIANRNSGKLHSIDCDSLPYEKNRIYFSTIEEANNAGYSDKHKECMGG